MVKKRKKQLTANQKAYKKEMDRIARWMKSVSKRGYTLKRGRSINLVMPSRVTEKALRDIRRLTPEVLYYSYEKLDVNTGELVPGSQARKLERKKSARKGYEKRIVREFYDQTYGKGHWIDVTQGPDVLSESDRKEMLDKHVINIFREELQDLHPKGAYVLTKWLNETISKYGNAKTAQIIGLAKENGVLIEPGESYKNEVLSRYIAQMSALMKEVDTSPELIKEFEDAMDEEEEIDDLEDYF